MAATRVDAEAGWEIFKGGNFGLTREDVNEALVRNGYGPISDRTFRHYHKLQRFGYDYYIPINQLDVKTLDNPFWDQAVRGRYTPLPARLDVVLTTVTEAGVEALSGTMVRLSDGEGVVRLVGDAAVQFFSSLERKERTAELLFTDTGERIVCTAQRLSLDVDSQVATVRVAFTDAEAVDQLPSPPALDVVVLTYESLGPGSHPMTVVVEQFYWLFQAVEGMRVVCQEILRELDPAGSVVLPPARVRRISHQSPMEIDLETAKTVAFGVWAIWVSYQGVSTKYWERIKTREEAMGLRWENQRSGVDRRLMPKRILDWLVDRLKSDLRDKGVEPAVDRPKNTERSANILRRQVAPAISELASPSENGQLTLPGFEPPALNAYSQPRFKDPEALPPAQPPDDPQLVESGPVEGDT